MGDNSLLALGVEIYSTNATFLLIEANVIKAFKRGTIDGTNTMVGYEKVFLPAHKDVLALRQVRDRHDTLAHLLAVLSESGKLAPMI